MIEHKPINRLDRSAGLWDGVILEIIQHFRVYPAEVLSKSRKSPIPDCRAAVLCRMKLEGYSDPEIELITGIQKCNINYRIKSIENKLEKYSHNPRYKKLKQIIYQDIKEQ